MSLQTIINIVDILLWSLMAASTLYVLTFSLASLLPSHSSSHGPAEGHPQSKDDQNPHPRFLILFPAYHEDAVILNSVKTFLQQDYPPKQYQVAIISDHMSAETNRQLAKLPITLLQPTFEKSSKAKALQYAMESIHDEFDYVVILDADNVVATDFLSRLALIANKQEAIQCHRTAKNADNDIAALDGISEEINNCIFRCGHNRIGMSSALIGSGMCFNYDWFKNNVNYLNSAVEDRELEALFLKQRIFIRYANDIYVMDEKVNSSDNFQRQRLRWMTGQVLALFRMLPYIPKALVTLNINYIDKTIQQALIPRSILLVFTTFFTLIATILSLLTSYFSPFFSFFSPLKWWVLLACLALSLIIAIPPQLRNKAILGKALTLPKLVWRMLTNILHIKPKNKEFIHTTHHQ